MPSPDDPTAAAREPRENQAVAVGKPSSRGKAHGLRRAVHLAWLPVGVVLLLNAWSAWAGASRFERFVAGLTARADAEVAAVVWRLDRPGQPIDPIDPSQPLRGQLRPALALRLAHRAPDGAIAEIDLLATEEPGELELWPWGGPQSLERILGLSAADPRSGLPRLELLVPDPLLLELDGLRRELDRPLESLAALWMRPAGNRPIRVHFDPSNPATALPAVTLGSGWALRFFRRSMLLLLCGGLGVGLLFAGLGALAPSRSGLTRAALALTPLVALPLWGPPVERATPPWLHPTGNAESWARLGPVRLAPRDGVARTTWVVDFPGSRFAPTLARFRFARPQGVAWSREVAWRAVVAQLSAQVAAFSDEEALALLDELAACLRENRRELSAGFLAPLDELSRAAERPAAVREAAAALLVAHLAPGAAAPPGEFAPRVELAEVASLLGHPDSAVAAAARGRLAELAPRDLRP